MTEYSDQVIAALHKVPGFDGAEADSIPRLGGMTNLVHRVDSGAGSVIVRIPGAGTEEYIGRCLPIKFKDLYTFMQGCGANIVDQRRCKNASISTVGGFIILCKWVPIVP